MPQKRQLHDAYFRKAKAEGYLARSAYKLLQIQEKRGLIRRGNRVLDLGCAPGSWLQVASKLVGPEGLVAGLDLQESSLGLPGNVRAAVGDIFATSAEQLLALGGISADGPGFDVVLSDMAPSTSGAAATDHFRSVDLCRRVLALLPGVLRTGGNLAMKVFEGEAYAELLRETQGVFREAKGFKPDASRDVSREIYIVAKGYRGGAEAAERGGAAAAGDIAPAPPRVSAGWGESSGGGGA